MPKRASDGNLQVTLTITGSNSAATTRTELMVTAHIRDAGTGAVYTASEKASLSVISAASPKSHLAIGQN